MSHTNVEKENYVDNLVSGLKAGFFKVVQTTLSQPFINAGKLQQKAAMNQQSLTMKGAFEEMLPEGMNLKAFRAQFPGVIFQCYPHLQQMASSGLKVLYYEIKSLLPLSHPSQMVYVQNNRHLNKEIFKTNYEQLKLTGIPGLFKGNIPSCITQGLKGVVKGGVASIAKDKSSLLLQLILPDNWQRQNAVFTFQCMHALTSALFLAGCEIAAAGPTERLSTWLSTAQGKHANAEFSWSFRNLYTGAWPSFMKTSFSHTILFGFRDSAIQSTANYFGIKPGEPIPFQVSMVSNATLALFIALVSAPLDSIKTNMQAAGTQNHGVVKGLKILVETHGVTGPFKGCTPKLLSMFFDRMIILGSMTYIENKKSKANEGSSSKKGGNSDSGQSAVIQYPDEPDSNAHSIVPSRPFG